MSAPGTGKAEATATTFTLEVNGATLEIDDSARIDPQAHAKPTIITLHGAPGMGSRRNDWDVYAAFTDRFRVVSYDQRGSGASSDTPPYTHEQFAADTDAVRKALDLGDKIVIAGGSYGGYLAQEYALRYPQHVTAVVLRDTAAHSGHKGEAMRMALESPYPMDVPGLERLFAGHTTSDDDFRALITMIMPLYTTTYDAERDARQVAAMQLHYATHNYAFAHNQTTFDLRPLLGELTAPVLITVGRHDWITPLPASEELHALLPDSELVIFENSGHGPQNEEREAWHKAVREFLERRVLA